MADGHELTSSTSSLKLPSKFESHSLENVTSKEISNNLILNGNQLQWNGSLEKLKRFFSNTLNIRGKWKSPGGDVKMFSSQNEEPNVKWNGPKSKRINIVKDINNMFFDTMKTHASKGKSQSIEQDSHELDAYVVEAVCIIR